MTIWGKIKSMWKNILSDVPAEVANRDDAIDQWFQAYKMQAPWLDYTYRTVDGHTRKRRRLSMGMAKVGCSELNSLVFSEDPVFTGSEKVLEVLEANSFTKNLAELSEYTLALGGGAMKVHSDGQQIFIDYVKAQNFVPISWDNTRVTEAHFVSNLVRGDKKLMLVETHRKADGGYTITNEMYDRGTNQKVTLPDDIEKSVFVATPVPLFAYIRPHVANNFDPESPLGVSIYANAMDTLQALDIAFDSLNSEMVLGKKRIIVPQGAIRSVIDPDTGKPIKFFDPTDEVFVGLSFDEDETLRIQDNSVELRIEEIKLAIQTLLDVYAIQIGFSRGHFSFDGGQVKTATEVISDNSKTFKTKKSYENNLADGIIDLMNAIAVLVKTDEENGVLFDDSVIEDRNSKAMYWINLYSAGLVDKETALQKIHGLDEAGAAKMATKLVSMNVNPFPGE
jgi:A118 family predicted phage portal protein